VPYELAYHSLLTYNDRVYLYGGYNGVKFGTSLLVLDQTNGTWEVVDAKGVAPQPRCGCAAQVVGKHLFVFGGYTKDGHTNEMYKFDMETRTWESVEARDKRNHSFIHTSHHPPYYHTSPSLSAIIR
jgi:N-acetylneuraminic acid mutarotase